MFKVLHKLTNVRCTGDFHPELLEINGRLFLHTFSEAGYISSDIDLFDLIKWLSDAGYLTLTFGEKYSDE